MNTTADPHGVVTGSGGMQQTGVDEQGSRIVRSLAPPIALEPGSIVTVRMAAHVRSPGMSEYFSPAVVLAQYDDDWGSIDALVWDSSAGTHFANGYHTRELAADMQNGRPTGGMVETRSNIGRVLFSPDVFASMQQTLEELHLDFISLKRLVQDLQGKPAVQPVQPITVQPAKPK